MVSASINLPETSDDCSSGSIGSNYQKCVLSNLFKKKISNCLFFIFWLSNNESTKVNKAFTQNEITQPINCPRRQRSSDPVGGRSIVRNSTMLLSTISRRARAVLHRENWRRFENIYLLYRYCLVHFTLRSKTI